MKALSARDAKYNFGRMIDLARSEPLVVEKHGRPVVVVMAVEEFEKLTGVHCQRRSKNLPDGGVKVGHFGVMVSEPSFS